MRTGEIKVRWRLSVAALGLLWLAAPAAAQVSDDDLGDLAPLLALFPEARTAPGPGFLAAGVRITYQSAGAVIGSPDPVSGGGIIQYDVVTRDAAQILAHQHAYANDGAGSYPTLAGVARGYPGIGPFWIQPAVLVNAERFAGGNLRITRYQKPVAGRNANVVRFQTATGNGQTVFEFDADTGALVFNSLTAGNQAAQLTLLGVRALPLPWGPGRAPNWARPGVNLAYTGVKATTIPGAGTVNQRLDVAIRIAQAGARWSVLDSTSAIDGRPQGGGPGVTGQAQLLGGIWLPQSALGLALNPQGVRVDQDPHSGAEVYLGRGEGGGAVIQEVTPVARSTFAYHPTLGVLVRSIQEVALPTSTTVTDLTWTGGDDLEALSREPPLPEDPVEGGAGGGGAGGAGGEGGEDGAGGAGGGGSEGDDAGPSTDGAVPEFTSDEGGGCRQAPVSAPTVLLGALLLGIVRRPRRARA